MSRNCTNNNHTLFEDLMGWFLRICQVIYSYGQALHVSKDLQCIFSQIDFFSNKFLTFILPRFSAWVLWSWNVFYAEQMVLLQIFPSNPNFWKTFFIKSGISCAQFSTKTILSSCFWNISNLLDLANKICKFQLEIVV